MSPISARGRVLPLALILEVKVVIFYLKDDIILFRVQEGSTALLKSIS